MTEISTYTLPLHGELQITGQWYTMKAHIICTLANLWVKMHYIMTTQNISKAQHRFIALGGCLNKTYAQWHTYVWWQQINWITKALMSNFINNPPLAPPAHHCITNLVQEQIVTRHKTVSQGQAETPKSWHFTYGPQTSEAIQSHAKFTCYRVACRTYLMPRAKLLTQTSRKPSGNLALRDGLTFSLLAKLNSHPSFFVTRVRSTSLLLHRLYKECKTTPNYFSPTPTSHGEGEESARERGREWRKRKHLLPQILWL